MKIDTLRNLMNAGDWPAAVRFAAKFPRLGAERDAILRAKDALNNPEFYRQIGQYPDSLFEAGVQALTLRFRDHSVDGLKI